MTAATDEIGRKIISYIHDNEPVTVHEIASHVHRSTGLMRRYLCAMIQAKIIIRRQDVFNIKGDARTRLYSINTKG